MEAWLRMRIAFALVVAVVAACGLYIYERQATFEARRLLTDGHQATATVVSASVRPARSWLLAAESMAEVDYRFIANDGRLTGGRDTVAPEELDAMTDPADPQKLRADAAVDILYLDQDPLANGIRPNLEERAAPDLAPPVLGFLIVGLCVFTASGRLTGRAVRSATILAKS